MRAARSIPRVPSRRTLADAANRIVAGVVAKGVVEVLEIVDVDHQQTERMLEPQHASDLTLELTFKAATVRQAGQVVRKRSLFTNVEISLELEQGPGPGQHKVQVSRIGDVAQALPLLTPAADLPRAGSPPSA